MGSTKKKKKLKSAPDFLQKYTNARLARAQKATSVHRDIADNGEGPGLGALAPAQHGRIRREGRIGNYALADDVADQGIFEKMNELLEKEKKRWWTVRLVFAFGKYNGVYTKTKKASIYTLSPMAPTSKQSEQVLHLPMHEQAEALDHMRKQVETVRAEQHFVLEQPVHKFACANVNRQRLASLVLSAWSKEPVSTLGNIDILWPDGHVKLVSTREQLLTSHGQEEILKHINAIFALMDKGFRYDPSTRVDPLSTEGKLRRFTSERDHRPVYKGGPLTK